MLTRCENPSKRWFLRLDNVRTPGVGRSAVRRRQEWAARYRQRVGPVEVAVIFEASEPREA